MRNLFIALEREGTATLVGDAINWPGQGGSYVSWFRSKFERNLAHSADSFVQFDNLTFCGCLARRGLLISRALGSDPAERRLLPAASIKLSKWAPSHFLIRCNTC